MKKLLKSKGNDQSTFTEEEKSNAIGQNNKYMRRLVENNYLSKHFKNSLNTVDDYFMFRKQFSNYYASNSFLTYAFKLNENSLNNIKICSRHGRVFHNDCKIRYNDSKTGLENPDEKVPFRLTDNIKEFITDIGLKSLFPGVMTVCSMAIKSRENYVKSFLKFSFEQDLHGKDGNSNKVTDDIILRMQSIAKPYFDSDISQLVYLAEEDEQKREEIINIIKMANLSLSKERFNEFAYELIKQAGDKKILHEMHPLFVSWF